MSDIPSFPYEILWGEREILSVANLTRADGHEFMQIAAEAPIKTHTTTFALAQANEALRRLKTGELEGAAVLVP
jgi:propanol-preferring alcohol dehydrogenase